MYTNSIHKQYFLRINKNSHFLFNIFFQFLLCFYYFMLVYFKFKNYTPFSSCHNLRCDFTTIILYYVLQLIDYIFFCFKSESFYNGEKTAKYHKNHVFAAWYYYSARALIVKTTTNYGLGRMRDSKSNDVWQGDNNLTHKYNTHQCV